MSSSLEPVLYTSGSHRLLDSRAISEKCLEAVFSVITYSKSAVTNLQLYYENLLIFNVKSGKNVI